MQLRIAFFIILLQLQTHAETVEAVQTLRTQVGQSSSKLQALQSQIQQSETDVTRSLRRPILNRNLCVSSPCSHGEICVSRFNANTCICPPPWEV
ncbi:hypothetical protein V5799_005436 [Amblyomma americanum]|uniref:EGF-like domain-containing protein n=1 Tax=Amblyomma americanum TaxID=6943 RepID=A0AAQ4DZ93_AMBAM